MDTKAVDENTPFDFLTAREIATSLKVGRSTIYGWTTAGRIPHVKVNGVIRFPRNQVWEWLQQHTVRPTASSHHGAERIGVARSSPLTHRTMADAAARVRRRLISTKKSIHHGGGQ